MLSRMIKTALTATLLFLDHPKRSISKEMIFSNTATTVVKAANVRNKKKSPPQKAPPGIWAKILGMVIKIRLLF